MNQLTSKKPKHQAIYAKIKQMILFGDFVPGQPLTIHGLADSISAGVTPVREAIRRLSAEGALKTQENRRVEVPIMDAEKLQQIQLARLAIEPELAVLGAKNCNGSNFLELERLDGALDKAIDTGDIHGYLKMNYQFHFILYSVARAPVLQRIAESLWLQISPSLRVGCGRFGTSNFTDHHLEATAALRVGDVEKVKQAFVEDILQGMTFVQQSLIS